MADRYELNMPSDQLDPVNPDHYGGDLVMRAIEACEANFARGSIAKYVLRAGKKDEHTELEDLKKARWYLNREIERLEKD